MSWTAPATSDFKNFFPMRYFPYGTGMDSITDADIQLAINTAQSGYNWNPANFDGTVISPAGQTPQSMQTIAFFYLAAHILTLNIQAAGGLKSEGVLGGVHSGAEGIVDSKSVGGISQSQSYPSWLKESPALWSCLLTRWGRQYLDMLLPSLVGNMYVVGGEQLPLGWF